jgi:hypothetical protein
MRKPLVVTALFAALAIPGGMWYVEGAAQHRKPAESTPSAQQPAQPRQPPQATPRDGQKSAPDTPRTGQAVPRPPDARREPDRPRRGPERGPVIVPYPGWPWWTYPYDYPPPMPWRVYADWERANVRLDVSPNDAQVYVDSYYAGVVDDFDGIFQRLTLRPGTHLIEVRKADFRTLVAEVSLYPGQSITYRRTMEPLAEAESQTSPFVPGFDEGAATPAPLDSDIPPGHVRFDVTPKDAAIYADGFYAGIADDFNGSQHLLLGQGRHHLSIRLDGYESVDVDLSVDSGATMTYRGLLKKLD